MPDVDLEVCAIRVHRVGSGLPCIYHSNPNSRETHANSDSARQFYDAGSLEIGATCPVNYPNGDGKANQFTASMYWRRPQKQDTPTSTELFLGGGMSVVTKYVWPLAEKYEVAGTLEAETKGILAFRDDVVDPGKIFYQMPIGGPGPLSFNFSDPFVTSYPIITTRGRTSEAFMMEEGFFIKYILKFAPGTMGTYRFRVWETTKHLKLCKLQVQHIGSNLPCTKVPTQSATDHDSMIFWNNITDDTASTCGIEPGQGGIEFVVSKQIENCPYPRIRSIRTYASLVG